jgi:hypothetical protein
VTLANAFVSYFDRLLAVTPYSFAQKEKESVLLDGLNELTARHAASCPEYRRILDGLWSLADLSTKIEGVPYLPVSIFKSHSLSSVPESDVRMTLTSSGTTGQQVSRIPIDAETSLRQQRALANSLSHILGPKRLPMLVIDSGAVFKDPKLMSARGAGVLGIMRYGREHAFALGPDLKPDIAAVRQFLAQHGGRPFFMFGFTFMVWLEFYERFKGEGLDLSNGILIHSGGWKKMIDRAVTPADFRSAFQDDFRLDRIANFYGMVEQIGTIFLEGPDGLLYPPNFADVVIRDPSTWRACEVGQTGIVQVLSLLPGSYPGHSLLTEDLGRIEAIDAGVNGWMGKGIRVFGRVPKSELRGCSDVIGVQAA